MRMEKEDEKESAHSGVRKREEVVNEKEKRGGD